MIHNRPAYGSFCKALTSTWAGSTKSCVAGFGEDSHFPSHSSLNGTAKRLSPKRAVALPS